MLHRNEACVLALMAAAVTLCEITIPIDCDMLEGALGKAFAALSVMDGRGNNMLFCLLGFWVLLESRLLEAIARLSLSAAHQACRLSTYNG